MTTFTLRLDQPELVLGGPGNADQVVLVTGPKGLKGDPGDLTPEAASVLAQAQLAANVALEAIDTMLIPIIIDGDYTAAPGAVVRADTSLNGWTLTLPAQGGSVVVRDHSGTWGSTPLTIDGNGATIDGAATWLADVSSYEIAFTRVGAEWRYTFQFIYGDD